MIKLRSVSLAAGLAFGLAACAGNPDPGDGVLDNVLGKLNAGLAHDPFMECSAENAAKMKDMNWAQATVFDVEIRQGQFSPSNFDMSEGKPYILRFVNADEEKRAFRAAEFFDNATVGQVKFGDQVVEAPCVNTFILDAAATVEMQVVPHKFGRYRWHDNPVIFGPVFTRGAGFGIIEVHKG